MPDYGHILRAVAGAQTALVLVVGDVDHPMQCEPVIQILSSTALAKV
jgi:hypothetical protein